MNTQEMIETIRSNYPPENYSMLQEALDHCLTLLDAEAEGRLLILPCKPGDTVYYLTGNPALVGHFDRVESTRVLGFYWDENGLQICLKLPRGSHGTYGYFEETVFLTREEAEAALKEPDNGR